MKLANKRRRCRTARDIAHGCTVTVYCYPNDLDNPQIIAHQHIDDPQGRTPDELIESAERQAKDTLHGLYGGPVIATVRPDAKF